MTIDVHLVDPEREIWSGEASYVVARTTEGDVGILPDHQPTFSLLAVGEVKIDRPAGDDGPQISAIVDGGFLSVGRDQNGMTRVDVLASKVTLPAEINGDDINALVEKAQELERLGQFDMAKFVNSQALIRSRLQGGL